ncbi:MAG: hypothetical protein EB010_01760 [Acidimicrobiia bacterium]|nr:hypothetical protein [Acidimicrobiia bacterium]
MKRLAIGTAALLVMVSCSGSSGGSTTSDGSTPSDGSTATSNESTDDAVIDSVISADPIYADLVIDGSTRVASEIGPDGGELLTTSANGDSFRLIIPAGALSENVEISMSASSNDAISGVNIEPDGLPLNGVGFVEMMPATTVDGATSVWWDGTGEIGRPVASLGDDGVIRFAISHFSGYGQSTSSAPAPTPIDDALARIRSELSKAISKGVLDGTELQNVEAELRATWKSYLKPLLKTGSKAGCGARNILNETVRLDAVVQILGFDELDGEIQEELQKQLDPIYESMKNCARQECSEGKTEAPMHMLSAVQIGQLFGSSKAENEGMSVMQEVFLSGVKSPWVRCRAFDASLSFDMTWEFRLMTPDFSTLHGVSVGKGVLEPVEGGHSGDVGTWEIGSGVADFASKNGSMLLTGLSMMVGGGEQNVSCSESSSNRGLVRVSLSWNTGDLPLAKLEPLSSPITVSCSSAAGSSSGDFPNPAFLLLTFDPATEGFKSSFEHQFTEKELWPSGGLSSVPLGFHWNELIDVQPLIAADGGGDINRRADTKVSLKLLLASQFQAHGMRLMPLMKLLCK